MAARKKILFVCYANMIRSQMAEGFARKMGGSFLDVYSAGVHPTGVVSEEAREVMAEKGIDISDQSSKPLDAVPLTDMDYIINMSGYPSNTLHPASYQGVTVDWKIEDPVGKPMDYYRSARDTIEKRMREFIKQLWKQSPTPES